MTDDQQTLQLEKLRHEVRKMKAEADAAEQTAAGSFSLPDFSKAERGTLTAEKGGEPAGGTGVVGRAVQAAARELKQDLVVGRFHNKFTLLITSDAALAASDGAYLTVNANLTRLTGLAETALKPDGEQPRALLAGLTAAADAIVTALPGLLTLLRTNRTITTGDVTIDDLTVAAAVADVLKRELDLPSIHHDTFRLLPKGALFEALEKLLGLRDQLLARQHELGTDEEAAAKVVTAIGEAIDKFVTGITTPDAQGATPLAIASMREGLHDGTFNYTLLVKSAGASAARVLDDKAFGKDRIAIVAAASIAWMVIDTSESATGAIVDAGVSSGTAKAAGRVDGSGFSFE